MPRSLFFILKLIAAIILLQTLYFKFTGAAESVYIFEAVGMEPWGRYASAVVELVAAVLLLLPSTAGIGAIIGLGVISGAILFHLTTLGIVVQGDDGLLFYLACVVFVCCAIIAWNERLNTPIVKRFFKE